MPLEIVLTLVILTFTILGFTLERFPVDLVGLVCLSSLILTGLVTLEEGFSGFSNPVTITIAALFVLSAGVQNSGLLEGLGQWIRRLFSRSFSLALFVLVLVVGVLSAFINNTAVVALFLPVVMSACRKTGVSPSKVLMPLSFASMFGGLCTLIGTSTNLIVSDISGRLTGRTFSMFETGWVGVPLFMVGLAYLSVVGVRLLPARRSGQALTQDFSMADTLHQVRLAGTSDGPLKEWRHLKAARPDLLALERPSRESLRPTEDSPLLRDDLLTLRSDEPVLDCSDFELCGVVTDDMIDSGDSVLVEVLVNPKNRSGDFHPSRLTGNELVPLAIRQGSRLRHRNLPQEQLQEGDTVLYSVNKRNLNQLDGPELTRLSPCPEVPPRATRWAAAVLAAVVIGATLNIVPIPLAAILGSVVLVLVGCLSMEQAYRSIEWKIIILLGAMFGLGEAMTNSGATEWLSHKLLGLTSEPTVALGVVYLVTVTLTSVLSNGATAVLLAPIAANLALSLQVRPEPFLIAVALAASSCFLSPVGYQTNLMVYGAGHYRFTDFLKVGLPLNILFALLTIILVPLVWPL